MRLASARAGYLDPLAGHHQVAVDRHIGVGQDQDCLGRSQARQHRMDGLVGPRRLGPAQIPGYVLKPAAHTAVAERRLPDPQLERFGSRRELVAAEADLAAERRRGARPGIHGQKPQRAGRRVPARRRRQHRVPDPEPDARARVGEREVVDLVVARVAGPAQCVGARCHRLCGCRPV